MTCAEVDALADLFQLIGQDDSAEAWRRHHAAGDDEGDAHNADGSPRSGG